MRKWLGLAASSALIALIAVVAVPARAQDNDNKVPSWEVGGGYTFRSYDYAPVGAGSPPLTTNGWDVMADRMVFRKWLSVAAQVDGTYTSEGYNTSVYSAMIGPQVYLFGHRRKLTPYFQALFGEGYTRYLIPKSGGYPALAVSTHDYTWQGGGGIDYSWKPHWNIRVIQFDYENTRFFTSNPTQGNYKISVGIMYRFGKLKKGR